MPFRVMCIGVFKSVDADKSGSVSEAELIVALAKMHFKLSKKCPGVSAPPSGPEVAVILTEYDMDASSGLSQDEFVVFCQKYFAGKGIAFLRNILVTSFITMVVLPDASERLRNEVPLLRRVPRVLFKVVFGFLFKTFATQLPDAITDGTM